MEIKMKVVHMDNLLGSGDSVGARTQDLLLRRQLLYPAELPNRPCFHLAGAKVDIFLQTAKYFCQKPFAIS